MASLETVIVQGAQTGTADAGAAATSSKVEDFGRRPDALSGRLGELSKNNGFRASPMLPQSPMNANGDLRPDGARTEFKDFTIRISLPCPKKKFEIAKFLCVRTKFQEQSTISNSSSEIPPHRIK
eukprot:scaffold10310_cov81-Cylindrotheca_fusiformis.AAC.1